MTQNKNADGTTSDDQFESDRDYSQEVLTLVNQILEELKNRDVERIVVQPFDDGGYTVLLSDYMYWAKYYDDLLDWCRLHDSRRISMAGMIVTVDSEETLTMFLLRWL
jgi:hypothetical protein